MNAATRACRSFAMAVAILGTTSEVLVRAQDLAGAPKLQVISGKVASVDLFRRMLTVESKALFLPAQTKTFVVGGEADISDRAGQQELPLHALHPGARVKIEYAAEGEKNVAHSIILQEPIPAYQSKAEEPDQTEEQRVPRSAEPSVEERLQAPGGSIP